MFVCSNGSTKVAVVHVLAHTNCIMLIMFLMTARPGQQYARPGRRGRERSKLAGGPPHRPTVALPLTLMWHVHRAAAGVLPCARRLVPIHACKASGVFAGWVGGGRRKRRSSAMVCACVAGLQVGEGFLLQACERVAWGGAVISGWLAAGRHGWMEAGSRKGCQGRPHRAPGRWSRVVRHAGVPDRTGSASIPAAQEVTEVPPRPCHPADYTTSPPPALSSPAPYTCTPFPPLPVHWYRRTLAVPPGQQQATHATVSLLLDTSTA